MRGGGGGSPPPCCPKGTCTGVEVGLPPAALPAKHRSYVRRCLIIPKLELLAGRRSLADGDPVTCELHGQSRRKRT